MQTLLEGTCIQIFLQQYSTMIEQLVIAFGYQKLTVSVRFPCPLFLWIFRMTTSL